MKGVLYCGLTLLAGVVSLLLAAHCNRWRLDTRLGLQLLTAYTALTILCSLYE